MYSGQIVCSLSGKDKGYFMVIVGQTDDKYLLVSDGKHRKLDNPKQKNIKHLGFVGKTLSDEQLKSDKSIRKAIYGFMQRYKEENVCQKKI